MWVLCGGMFRSGSTLQYQLVAELIERAGRGERLAWAQPEAFEGLADLRDHDDAMLVFKTHVCKHPMRVRLRDGRAVGVGTHRDLRDVAVSGACKAGVEPTPEYCAKLAEGCMACARGWPSTPSMRWWSYHELTNETARVVHEMSEHLSVPIGAGGADELAERFSPQRQRDRIEHALREGGMIHPIEGHHTQHMDRELLHPNHLADGREGKWRQLLSPESISVIERIAGSWLVEQGYPLSGSVRRTA